MKALLKEKTVNVAQLEAFNKQVTNYSTKARSSTNERQHNLIPGSDSAKIDQSELENGIAEYSKKRNWSRRKLLIMNLNCQCQKILCSFGKTTKNFFPY